MTAHLLIPYPIPKDTAKFDRAYRKEHLPYAGPRLVGATGVKTQRVVGPGFAPPPYHLMSDVSFPTLDGLKTSAACEDRVVEISGELQVLIVGLAHHVAQQALALV